MYRLTRESGRMLQATKEGDTETMTDILELVHNTESPLSVYSNEAELASIIRWVYLQALELITKYQGKTKQESVMLTISFILSIPLTTVLSWN